MKDTFSNERRKKKEKKKPFVSSRGRHVLCVLTYVVYKQGFQRSVKKSVG